MPVLYGQVESVEPVGVHAGDVGSAVDEELDHLQVALPGSQVEGRDLVGGREVT